MELKFERGLFGILRPIVDFNIMVPDSELSPAQRAVKKLYLDYSRRKFLTPIIGKIEIKELEEIINAVELRVQPQQGGYRPDVDG